MGPQNIPGQSVAGQEKTQISTTTGAQRKRGVSSHNTTHRFLQILILITSKQMNSGRRLQVAGLLGRIRTTSARRDSCRRRLWQEVDRDRGSLTALEAPN